MTCLQGLSTTIIQTPIVRICYGRGMLVAPVEFPTLVETVTSSNGAVVKAHSGTTPFYHIFTMAFTCDCHQL